MIREKGVKVGVTIKPKTPLSVLEPLLDKVDMILLMTVEPGFGGQAYIPESTDKIRALRKMLNDRGLTTDIEVDGGVDNNTIAACAKAGANVFVAGSYLFKNPDLTAQVQTLRDAIDA